MKPKEKEGKMQCMKCKEWFDTCRCWKSEGFIPKIWYCERCFGIEEGITSERKRVCEIIGNLNEQFRKDNTIWRNNGDELNDLWEEELLAQINKEEKSK